VVYKRYKILEATSTVLASEGWHALRSMLRMNKSLAKCEPDSHLARSGRCTWTAAHFYM